MRNHPGHHRLQQDMGIGQGQHLQRFAVGEIPLHKPDAGQRPEHKEPEDTELAEASQDQPLMSPQKTLGLRGFHTRSWLHGHYCPPGP